MTNFLRLLVLGIAIVIPGSAEAQPSYRCDGQLNRAERAICDSPELAALDVEMARRYFRRHDRLSGARQQRLEQRQAIWREWRDSCGGGVKCLIRRYENRIRDFTGETPTPQGPDDIVDRRVQNGRFEVEYGDGRVAWRRLSDGKSGTDFPDGTSLTNLRSQVETAPVPPWPGDMEPWGNEVEANLLGIVDLLLPEADRGPYRDLYANDPYTDRVMTHIGVIRHLMGGG